MVVEQLMMALASTLLLTFVPAVAVVPIPNGSCPLFLVREVWYPCCTTEPSAIYFLLLVLWLLLVLRMAAAVLLPRVATGTALPLAWWKAG